jgi:hypothetical protein
MSTETDRTKPKWYQITHWRWLPPGGYYGGFFAGIGLGIMLLAGAVKCDLIPPRWDAIFAAGAAILVIANIVCYHLEGRYDKNHGK